MVFLLQEKHNAFLLVSNVVRSLTNILKSLVNQGCVVSNGTIIILSATILITIILFSENCMNYGERWECIEKFTLQLNEKASVSTDFT